MKIFSVASAAALLLGAGAIIHSGPVRAELPISNCEHLNQECANGSGDQAACKLYQIACLGRASQGSIAAGTPPAKK